MQLKNLRIKYKLFILIGLMTAVTAIIAMFGISRIDMLNQSLSTVNTVDSAATLGARINQNTIIMSRSEYRIAADPSPETVSAARAVMTANRKQFSDRLGKVKDIADNDEKAQLEKIADIYAKYTAGLDESYRLADQLGGKVELSEAQKTINTQVKANRTIADELQANVKEFVDHLDARGTSVAESAKAQGEAAAMIMMAVAVGGSLFGIVVGYLLATFGVSLPLNRSVTELNILASGDLTVPITGADRGDECGDVAKGLEVFKANALKTRQLEADAIAQKQRAEEERKQAMRAMADQFENAVGGIVDMVSSAATEMQATAQQLSSSAQETTAQSMAVSAAAEEAATNVATVASAAEELGSSVNEIGRQVQRSSELSRGAVTEASETAAVVSEMTQGAARIGDIVELIAGIAAQTNLLALNATIEAARAGEAGRGFAVVASEVKNLAEQTSKATGEISTQIAGIQATTNKAVSAIGGISNTIRTLNEGAGSIAASVEQQGAATREIVQSVGQASAGASEVTSNISGVARAAEETGAGATQVFAASSELARQAETLRSEVRKILATVRAA